MRNIRALLGALLALAIVAAVPSSASAQAEARIHLIHGIPDTDVDVAAGGENVFTNFSFSDTQDLSSLAGATLEDLQVKLAGTDTVALDAGDVTLPISMKTEHQPSVCSTTMIPTLRLARVA